MEEDDLATSTQEPHSSNTQDLTQSANSTDPTLVDQDIDMAIDTNPEPSQPGPSDPVAEPSMPPSRDPTRKDISLRDFLSKMDEYAPIIPDAVTAHHLALAGLPPHSTPLQLSRLLALATQRFIADIAADAYQYSRMRSSASGSSAPSAAAASGAGTTATGLPGQSQQQTLWGTQKEEKGKGGAHMLGVQRAGLGGGGGGGAQGRAVLTMEDLGCAVGEYGVNVRRGEFYR